MRMTEVKTLQQGVVHTNNQVYVLHEVGNVVLLQFDISGGTVFGSNPCDFIFAESLIFAESANFYSNIWISPEHDCLIVDMSLLTFPEFDGHSVFSVSAINHGRSVSVCLVKGDVFDLK